MSQGAMLVARLGSVACAVPVEHVIETLRPLPVEPLAAPGDPALAPVDGLAMIRGAPVPVVDARRLLGVAGGRPARFVVLRVADRRVALAVDEVLDVRPIAADTLERLPPLLVGARRECVSALAACDTGLLVVLESSRVLSDDDWRAIEDAQR